MGTAAAVRRSGLRAGLLVLVLLFLSVGVAGPAIANPGIDDPGLQSGGDGPEPPDPPPPGPQDEGIPEPPEDPLPPPPPPGDDEPSGGGSGGASGGSSTPPPPTPPEVALVDERPEADGVPGKESDRPADDGGDELAAGAELEVEGDDAGIGFGKAALAGLSALLLTVALFVAFVLWRRSGTDHERSTF